MQITFQPYACRLLDTLRRLAMYSLMSTLFMLMLVIVSQGNNHDRLALACMIILAVINVAVVIVHLWACGREVRRWLVWTAGKAPDGKLSWKDVIKILPVTMTSCTNLGWLPCWIRARRVQAQSGGNPSQQNMATPTTSTMAV